MGIDRIPGRTLEGRCLETPDSDAGSNQEDTQSFPINCAFLQKNAGKNIYQQETQLIHRYDLRSLTPFKARKEQTPKAPVTSPENTQKS